MNTFCKPTTTVSRMILPLLGCATVLMLSLPAAAKVAARPVAGRAAIDVDPTRRGPVSGIGIEGQDVLAITDRMIRDILATPVFVNRQAPPQVVLDSANFRNESSQRINKDLIVNRLRVQLNRAASGRMVFVGRAFQDMVGSERQLKRDGAVDVGTTGLTQATAGGDFGLTGSISTLDSRDPATGTMQRYTQITFEMYDLERGTIVWSDMYEFTRAATDDIVYR